MSTHFTVPVNRSPCSGTRYQVMPSGLSAYLSQDEYSASMARIQAANRSTLGVRFLYTLSWIGYMMGLFQLFGVLNYGGYGYYGYESYYVNSTWMGLSVAVVSFIALICLGRYMRKRRAAQVAAAVHMEHIAYQARQPQLAWRVVNESLIEIEVVDHQPQHQIAALEHQVHFLQAQMAAQAASQQHHQAVDHELIAHQAAAAAAAAHHVHAHHPAPAASAPAPQYYPSVMPVAEPVYAQSVYQPAAGSVFAHPPPPQYYNQPRSDLRAPLVRSQYQY